MSTTAFNHETWITGSEATMTSDGWVAAGQVLAPRAPLGLKTATGEFHLWNPDASDGTQVAVRLTPFKLDTTAVKQQAPLIKTGTFNPELVIWPDGTTDVQKLGAFVGSPISLQVPRF